MGNIAYFDKLWAYMPVLLAISRYRTLDEAADQLNVNRTTVSRRLKTLERKLGGKLFKRTDGEYDLTVLGRELLAAAEAAELQLMTVEGMLPDQTVLNSGPLRITIAPNILPIIAPAFLAIANLMPQTRLEISSTYQVHEIEAREADIAIRIQKSAPDYPLVGRKLGNLPGALYLKKGSSDAQLKHIYRKGEAEIPPNMAMWQTDAQMIEIDDILGKKELIAAGGIGRLPVFMGDNDPRLERISKSLPDAGWQLWVISHEAFKSSLRVKQAIDEIFRYFAASKLI